MKSEGGLFEIWHTEKKVRRDRNKRKEDKGKRREGVGNFLNKKEKKKTKTKSVLDMAEIERRVEKKKRKRRSESFVGEEKKKEAKSVTLTAADLQCGKQPFLPPFYSFLFLVSIYQCLRVLLSVHFAI